jgi:hypothetical protein
LQIYILTYAIGAHRRATTFHLRHGNNKKFSPAYKSLPQNVLRLFLSAERPTLSAENRNRRATSALYRGYCFCSFPGLFEKVHIGPVILAEAGIQSFRFLNRQLATGNQQRVLPARDGNRVGCLFACCSWIKDVTLIRVNLR